MVNTQDVLRAARSRRAVLARALAIAAWRGRGRARARAGAACAAVLPSQAPIAALVIAALLGAVALGKLYAVEAAASGGAPLLAGAALSRQLDRALLRAVVGDAMVLTGLLMALLVAATTFSLVLRGFGTDGLIARGCSRSPATRACCSPRCWPAWSRARSCSTPSR